MRVMVQLRDDAARKLHQAEMGASGHGESETQQLLDATAELGVTLQPVHPGQTHPLLMPFFMVEVPNREAAETVMSRLQQVDSVEAAYLKPEEQLP